MTDLDHLTALRHEFPGFEFSEEMTAGGTRYIAQASDLATRLYAAITPDLGELRQALMRARAHPEPGQGR